MNTKKSILKLDKVLIIIWVARSEGRILNSLKILELLFWDEQNFEKFFKLAADKKEAARDEIFFCFLLFGT